MNGKLLTVGVCFWASAVLAKDWNMSLQGNFVGKNGFKPLPGSQLTIATVRYQNIQIAAEERQRKNLVSAQYSGKWIYVSYGNRYKPFRSYYFLKDPDFYNALGTAFQPTKRTLYAGLKVGAFQLGALRRPNRKSKTPGYYLASRDGNIFLAFDPSHNTHTIGSHISRKKLPRIFGIKNSLSVQSEAIFHKKLSYGYNSLIWDFPDTMSRFFVQGFREKQGKLNQGLQQQSTLQPKSSYWEIGFRLKRYTSVSYFRIRNQKWDLKVLQSEVPVFSSEDLGAIVLRGRSYNYRNKKKQNQIGAGVFYQYRSRESFTSVGFEKRKNGDKVSELRLHLAFSKGWALDISSMLLSRRNKLPSVFQNWSGNVFLSKTLNSKELLFKCKLQHSNFSLNLSHSRNLQTSKHFLWVNLQFRLQF